MKRKKRTKVQQEKRKILLEEILDKWVCFRQVIDDEEKFTYMKHRLRDGHSASRVEQIVLSDNPMETGVYYITDYEIDRVLDMAREMEIIKISPVRYDLEIGIFSNKVKFENEKQLYDYLVKKNYITRDEMDEFTNNQFRDRVKEEVVLGFITNN